MSDSAQHIITLIAEYTSQMESLDQLNNNYIMSSLGFVGVILGIIVTLMSVRNSEKLSISNASIYKLISTLFMCIPIVSCIYVVVATITCRKVAIYRSYLVYLEEEYNRIPNVVPQKLNIEALDFLSKWSLDNPNGSMMNTIVIFVYVFIISVTLIVCFIMAFVFFNKSRKLSMNRNQKYTTVEKFMLITFVFIMILCVVICAVCIVDLCVNDVAVNNVLNYLQ